MQATGGTPGDPRTNFVISPLHAGYNLRHTMEVRSCPPAPSQLLRKLPAAGVHNGADGGTQTRLGDVQIRRETLNAIIKPSARRRADRTHARGLIEACQKLIAFAAALSAKEDAILKLRSTLPPAIRRRQAYEHHDCGSRGWWNAPGNRRFPDALCRIGE